MRSKIAVVLFISARVLTASLTAERANTSPMGGGGDYKTAAAPVTTLRLRPSSADPIDTGRSGGRVDKKQEYSGANREQPSLQDVEKKFRKLVRESYSLSSIPSFHLLPQIF